MMPRIDVACAVFVHENQFLAVRRGVGMEYSGSWEFPGGKLLPGETPQECIIREIKEELSVVIRITDELQLVEYDYPNRKVRLIPFLVELVRGEIELLEHDNFEWRHASELIQLPWLPADIPIVQQIVKKFSDKGA